VFGDLIDDVLGAEQSDRGGHRADRGRTVRVRWRMPGRVQRDPPAGPRPRERSNLEVLAGL